MIILIQKQLSLVKIKYGNIAQSAEQAAVNRWVVGSSPTVPATGLLFVSFIRPTINLVETNSMIKMRHTRKP